MSSVLTDTKSILVPKIPVTVLVYEGKNRYQVRQKSVPNWYLTSFGSGNLVPVPSIVCLSLTTDFIRTTSLPYNLFIDSLSVIF
ncbi:hypothetical protein Hanom_Chr06g00577601 [Helianthus anomalus]